jgi:guanosine-3',5'-bis(diphosphate) 3'-pyrophosphohydrolase
MKAETLEAIIKFTDNAHGEQMRKYTDERYIVHPVRVMQTCQQYSHDPALLAAALLHDVLEDTPVTESEIRSFLSSHLSADETNKAVQYVVELTDVFIKKKFPRMNRQKRKEKEADRLSRVSAEAQTIKYADIMDNAVNIVLHDQNFGSRYLKESQMILDVMQKGHPVLYERALHTVKECRENVRHTDELK